METVVFTDHEAEEIRGMLRIEGDITADAILSAVQQIFDAARLAIANDVSLGRSLDIDCGRAESPVVTHARQIASKAKGGSALGEAENPMIADATRRAREAASR